MGFQSPQLSWKIAYSMSITPLLSLIIYKDEGQTQVRLTWSSSHVAMMSGRSAAGALKLRLGLGGDPLLASASLSR